jgi:carbon-monoxide dehydrogenase medium subunit
VNGLGRLEDSTVTLAWLLYAGMPARYPRLKLGGRARRRGAAVCPGAPGPQSPARSSEAENLLRGRIAGAPAAAMIAAAISPPADLHASTGYRRHLAGVLVRRAATEACGNAARPRS